MQSYADAPARTASPALSEGPPRSPSTCRCRARSSGSRTRPESRADTGFQSTRDAPDRTAMAERMLKGLESTASVDKHNSGFHPRGGSQFLLAIAAFRSVRSIVHEFALQSGLRNDPHCERWPLTSKGIQTLQKCERSMETSGGRLERSHAS
jgi:hypothetical protein